MIAPRPDPVGYRELASLLRGQIMSGAFAPGERLPSELELVQTHQVARETVRRAVRLLSDEGLVDIRHGYPTRVRQQPERKELPVRRGARVTVRPATAEERDHYESAWIVEIAYLGQVDLYGADRVILVYR